MVALDEEGAPPVKAPEAKIVGKKERAHSRQVVGVWPFVSGAGQIGLVTVGHDSVKLWRVDEMEDSGVVVFTERHEIKKYRCGVQAADVSADGKRIVVLGLDSVLYEVVLNDSNPAMQMHDFGYMEAWHIKIAKNQKNYMTTSFSDFLSEIDMDGKFSRREQYPKEINMKHVTSLAYSNDSRFLAVANTEGVVHLIELVTMKRLNSFEIHAMKIRAMVFTPDDQSIVTAADDRTLKLHTLFGDRPGVVRNYCGNKAPIMCVVFDESSNGTRFASSNQAGEVMIWDIDEGTPIITVPQTHDSMVSSVAFSPSGRHLFSVGDDKQLVCYSIPLSSNASLMEQEDGAIEDPLDMDMNSGNGESMYSDRKPFANSADNEMEV